MFFSPIEDAVNAWIDKGKVDIKNNKITQAERQCLFATEPAGEAALGLGGAVLDRLVKLVDGLEGLCFGVLDVGLGLFLGLANLAVSLRPLQKNKELAIWPLEKLSLASEGRDPEELTALSSLAVALSTVAPASAATPSSFPPWALALGALPGRAPRTLALALCRSPGEEGALAGLFHGSHGSPRARDRGVDRGGDLTKRTLKLVLGGLGVAAGAVEVVSDTTSGTEAEDQGHTRLGHFGDLLLDGGKIVEVVGLCGCERGKRERVVV